jgi:hypothetical protein
MRCIFCGPPFGKRPLFDRKDIPILRPVYTFARSTSLSRFGPEAQILVCGQQDIESVFLPNVGDIDDALVRPGRCFATVRTRALDRGEAAALAARLGADSLIPAGLRSVSLAAFYKLVDDARAAAQPTST